MSDLQLDTDDDVLLEGGDFVLIAGNDAVAQHAAMRIRMIKGEWFEDTRIGVDYFGTIFVRPYNEQVVNAYLKQALLSTPGVDSLVSFSSSSDTTTRALTVTAQLKIGDSVIDFSEQWEFEI